MSKPLPIPVFRLAFRIFFLSGALFGLAAIVLWALLLNNQLAFNPYGGALFWHSHEMLHGFVSAIIVGFLLTAVQNWTSIPSVKGAPLQALFCLWLAGRLAALYDWEDPVPYILIDMIFLPCAAFYLARPIFNIRQYRNMFFVPVLLLMATGNGLMHAGVTMENPDWVRRGSQMTVWLVVFIMSVLGGRVIPMFTANGTRTPKTVPIGALEKLTLISTLLLATIYTSGTDRQLSAFLMALLHCSCGTFHLIRWLRWRFWVGLRTPLVWSLHTAYCFIPLGLLATGFSYAQGATAMSSTHLHFFTAGAMGALIIAMMSRVSLGHSGRPLTPPPIMSIAFAAIFIAGLTRSLMITLIPQWQGIWINISSALWITAFGLFCWFYAPVLTHPRVDGKPG